jgi:hypothetical protein
VDKKAIVYTLYKKLLKLYPPGFRERFRESMEQTFHDLRNEQKGRIANGFFMLSLFAETAVGIIREHLFLFMEGGIMKNILANPTSAAIISFILALPIGFLRLVLGSDIEPLVAPIESVLTIDGSRPNVPGYAIICGGLLLLPVAFVLNLRPILKRESPEGTRRLYTLNLIVGLLLLLLIISTWGGLILEEIYCLRGISCD